MSLSSCGPFLFFFSSRRRHTRWPRDWSSDVCSSDLHLQFCIVRIFPESADVSHHHHTLIHIPFVHQINRAIKVIINFRQIHHGLAALRKDRKSTRLNSSHVAISYAVFCLKKKTHISLCPY